MKQLKVSNTGGPVAQQTMHLTMDCLTTKQTLLGKSSINHYSFEKQPLAKGKVSLQLQNLLLTNAATELSHTEYDKLLKSWPWIALNSNSSDYFIYPSGWSFLTHTKIIYIRLRVLWQKVDHSKHLMYFANYRCNFLAKA